MRMWWQGMVMVLGGAILRDEREDREEVEDDET